MIFQILANYKICNQSEEFVKYSILRTKNFRKNIIEQCEIPNCHKKRYNIHKFFDKYQNGKNTTRQYNINHHGYSIQANEVFIHFICTSK